MEVSNDSFDDRPAKSGPVAQLDRATVSGAVCRGFESLLDHIKEKGTATGRALFFI